MSYGSYGGAPATITITFMNWDGAGYAEPVSVPVGTTLEQFFSRRTSNADPRQYVLRVNRNIAVPTYQLQAGDTVTFSPKNVKGA